MGYCHELVQSLLKHSDWFHKLWAKSKENENANALTYGIGLLKKRISSEIRRVGVVHIRMVGVEP